MCVRVFVCVERRACGRVLLSMLDFGQIGFVDMYVVNPDLWFLCALRGAHAVAFCCLCWILAK